MRLAVLLHLVGEPTQAPIFLLLHLATAFGDERGHLLGDRFDLLLGDVIACDEHAFVERHVISLWLAQPWPRDGARKRA